MSDRVAGLKFKAKQTIDGKSLTSTVSQLTQNYNEYGERFVFLEKWICNARSKRRREILTKLKTKTSKETRVRFQQNVAFTEKKKKGLLLQL